MIIALVFTFAALAASPACHPVEGERITSRDLAAADSRLASLPETAELGFAPVPGMRRMVHAIELSRLAARFGVPSDGFSDLCFERPVHPLDPGEIVSAMQTALGIANAHIEIVDVMRYPVPAGAIEFPRTGLTTPPPASPKIAVLWRGHIVTASGRRFPIWARVKIEAAVSRPVAVVDLRPGVELKAEQVRIETSTGFPDAPSAGHAAEDLIGRMLVRSVRAGAVIPPSAFALRSKEPAGDVARGERVTVSVQEGGAHLQFEARSEAPGKLGQTIPVRNIASGKTFMAQVSGKGKVSVGDTPQP